MLDREGRMGRQETEQPAMVSGMLVLLFLVLAALLLIGIVVLG